MSEPEWLGPLLSSRQKWRKVKRNDVSAILKMHIMQMLNGWMDGLRLFNNAASTAAVI
jgi:hypothetical protein